MDKKQIVIGAEYALREPPKTGVQFQRVRALENVRGSRWRVEWIEPNPGLVDFVASKNIIVPWKERSAFLRDERNAQALEQVKRQTFPGSESPLARAVDDVLEATGEGYPALSAYNGTLRYEADALARVSARAQIQAPTHPAGYTDRHGRNYLPFECALTLAQAFAAAEPRTVLDYIDIQSDGPEMRPDSRATTSYRRCSTNGVRVLRSSDSGPPMTPPSPLERNALTNWSNS